MYLVDNSKAKSFINSSDQTTFAQAWYLKHAQTTMNCLRRVKTTVSVVEKCRSWRKMDRRDRPSLSQGQEPSEPAQTNIKHLSAIKPRDAAHFHVFISLREHYLIQTSHAAHGDDEPPTNRSSMTLQTEWGRDVTLDRVLRSGWGKPKKGLMMNMCKYCQITFCASYLFCLGCLCRWIKNCQNCQEVTYRHSRAPQDGYHQLWWALGFSSRATSALMFLTHPWKTSEVLPDGSLRNVTFHWLLLESRQEAGWHLRLSVKCLT